MQDQLICGLFCFVVLAVLGVVLFADGGNEFSTRKKVSQNDIA
jgi:hypothetical protein